MKIRYLFIIAELLFFVACNNFQEEDKDDKPVEGAVAGFSHNNMDIYVMPEKILIFGHGRQIVNIKAVSFNDQVPVKREVLSADADTITLLLHYENVKEEKTHETGQTAKVTIAKVRHGIRFSAEPRWARRTRLVLDDRGGHYFGLTAKPDTSGKKSPDLRGSVVEIGQDNGTGVHAAFFMNSLGYGSFYDTFSKGRYKFAHDGKTTISHDTGKLDWYIFDGPEGKNIHQAYYHITGKCKYIPVWACGPVGWHTKAENGNTLPEDVKKMNRWGIPFTAWGLDMPYSRGQKPDEHLRCDSWFAGSRPWLDTLHRKYNLKLMTGISRKLMQDHLYSSAYKTDTIRNITADTGNKPHSFQNISNKLRQCHYRKGVSGHVFTDHIKQEMLPEQSADRPYPENAYLLAKGSYNIIHEALGNNHFTAAGTAYHGAHAYLSAISGNVSGAAGWQGLAGSLAHAVRCGYMGFPVWGAMQGIADTSVRSEKLFIRWMQWAGWSGLFKIRMHSGMGFPSACSDTLKRVVRKYCSNRIDLIPYIYSGFNTASRNGVFMKPLPYKWPADTLTYQIWDQYMFGNAFMVAPFYNEKNSRKIYLPEGRWYYYDDFSRSYNGKQHITFNADLREFPVFVKSNSIFVKGNYYRGTLEKQQDQQALSALAFYAFPAENVDSCTYNYVAYRENYTRKNIIMESKRNGVKITAPSFQNKAAILIKVAKKPKHISLNKEEIAIRYNEQQRLVRVNLPDNKPSTIKMVY